ncbi:MAG: sigma-70 family RNA polymerase sigma factor [Acidobacteriota bacterium]
MPEPSQELTGLLAGWAGGDARARDELLAIVYDELRRLAASCMRRERADHTLQPTALVHEAFLRLTHGVPVSWVDRSHFFRVAARAMRRILVDHQRRVSAAKRGSGQKDQLLDEEVLIPGIDVEVLALDEALTRLGALDERLLQVVEMRYFTGLGVEEVADLLGVSSRTVKRDWRSARAWLLAELAPADKVDATEKTRSGGR